MAKINRFFTSRNDKVDIHENDYYNDELVKKSVDENIKYIKDIMGRGSDLIIRDFYIGKDASTKIAICFIDGITNRDLIENYILSNLMIFLENIDTDITFNTYKKIKEQKVTAGEIIEIKDYGNLFNLLLSGDTILIIDGSKIAIGIGSKKWDDRGVMEPSTETATYGPKDSFNETLRTNTALIRRRVKDVNLRMDVLTIGDITNTDVVISYIKGLAPQDVVNELKKRINEIEMDGLLESRYIEKIIQDQKFSIFPLVGSTEHPDLIVAKLLEGRIAVIVDGTPFVIYAPYFLSDNFNAPEEHYTRLAETIFIRLLRYVSFFLSIFTPGLFVALTIYNPELLPPVLLLDIITQYVNINTPIVLELIIMLFVFELLRETSFRSPVLTSISILFVSGLVISQSVVEAGLVSNVMIIVISLTVVTSYIFRSKSINNTTRILRFFTLLLSSILGALGILLSSIVIVLHVNSLTTLNIKYVKPVPYNSDYVPLSERIKLTYKKFVNNIAKLLKKYLERGV